MKAKQQQQQTTQTNHTNTTTTDNDNNNNSSNNNNKRDHSEATKEVRHEAKKHSYKAPISTHTHTHMHTYTGNGHPKGSREAPQGASHGPEQPHHPPPPRPVRGGGAPPRPQGRGRLLGAAPAEAHAAVPLQPQEGSRRGLAGESGGKGVREGCVFCFLCVFIRPDADETSQLHLNPHTHAPPQAINGGETNSQNFTLPPLPSPSPVSSLLSSFLAYKKSSDPPSHAHWSSLSLGLQLYFDKSLPLLLLYPRERSRHPSSPRPSDLYGLPHLLRLFVRLPFLVESMGTVAEGEARSLLGKCQEIVRWLGRREAEKEL